MNQQHHLKIWQEPFAAVRCGRKTAEYRYVADRRFAVGDVLVLEEYRPEDQTYTGRSERRVITRIDRGPDFGIRNGYGMISFAAEALAEVILAVGMTPDPEPASPQMAFDVVAEESR